MQKTLTIQHKEQRQTESGRDIKLVPFNNSGYNFIRLIQIYKYTFGLTLLKESFMFKFTILILFSSLITGSYSEEIKVIVERNVPVPMRDGTILRADVHRPDRGGPYPVLVQRTPYGKGGDFSRFVEAGYIVVSQDTRGRFDSEGEFDSFWKFKTHEAEDGYDTVEWAAQLRGSTGKVGTFGTSWPANLQWRLASLVPPSLVAMAAFSVPARIWDGEKPCTIRPRTVEWMAGLAVDLRRRENIPGVNTRWEHNRLFPKELQKWAHWLPWADLPSDFFGHETESLTSWLKNPYADPWKLDEGCKDITVPNLDIVGWHDHANGDMLLFRTMVKEAKTEAARKGSRLIIGPWSHNNARRSYGNIDFGPDAFLDRDAVKIRWFDYWLKGKHNGVDNDAPVRIFVMGDNTWRDEPHWPLQRARDKTLFIDSAGNANTPCGNGRLIIERPGSAKTDTYIYDPTDPVPSPSGYSMPVPMDQRSLANRKDILVYQTEALAERVEVTGNPIVELYASSLAPDTDWFVRLIDVAPDGLARDVSSGLVRARYRNGFDKPELIRPGAVIKYTIRMDPTSNAFLPGHRIRFDITSSDFPKFDRNHNTAADQNSDAALVTAHQTIYHGAGHATRIILPWVPNPEETGEPLAEKPAGVEGVSRPQQPIYSLHQAATEGDIEQIKRLLSEGVDMDLLDQEGSTPLCHAIKAGKTEAARLLVEEGADVNAAGFWPPLSVAIDANDITTAEYLITHGARVDLPGRWPPLEQAPYSSSVEMVELLIDKGAAVNNGMWRAWEGTIEEGRKDILELLLRKGMDINSVDEDGLAPLGLALMMKNDEMVEFLLAKGAVFNLSYKDMRGLTALHYAVVAGNQETARQYLARGGNVNATDDVYGFTALHYAARFGEKKIAEALIANSADIKAKDKWGYQPLHWAAYHDRPDIVELLIAKGADVNARTSLDQTPLQLAVPRRNTAAIEVLRKYSNQIDASTSINVTNSDKSYVVLERGDVRAVIVNNEPVDDEVLPGHRGGYSGVASLTHRSRDKNLFVPFYAGLNFEHIHDGTNQPRDILFEPRQARMQIRQIDEYAAELYQPPTPNWQLESRLRYQLLDDGAIEMTLECIPRARTFKNDYIGLFFAGYIDQPESLDIHFLGRPADQIDAEPRWIRGVTPEHGKLPTHLAVEDNRNFAHDPNFPLTLVFNKSNYRYTEPWYYGVSGGMALVLMFRPDDNVRFSQSPSGGGDGNPAWDFQWFVPQYKLGQRYRFVMRAMYLPFESQQQIIRATAPHRAALQQQ